MAQPTEYEQVTYNAPDGAQMGRATTDKIAFYGTTPLSQQTVTSAIAAVSTISATGWGYATDAQAQAVAYAASTIAYALKQLGLVA